MKDVEIIGLISLRQRKALFYALKVYEAHPGLLDSLALEKVRYKKEYFDQIAKVYPGKVNTKPAQKAFIAARVDEMKFKDIMHGIDNECKYRRHAASMGIWCSEWRNLSTYFNSEGWKDKFPNLCYSNTLLRSSNNAIDKTEEILHKLRSDSENIAHNGQFYIEKIRGELSSIKH